MKPEEEGDKSIEFCEETQTIRVYRQEDGIVREEEEVRDWALEL